MFNSTHTLAGLVIARTGFDRWVPRAAWTAVIATNLPDFDGFTTFWGNPTYIEYHRGITHTLIGIPVMSLLLAAIMHKISGHFGRHLLLALIVMTTHPLLDLANVYGVRPFLPFSDTWYYGDTLFIIDPFLDLLLIAGLIACACARLDRRSLAAGIAIVLVTGYLAVRIELRDAARSRLAEYTQHVPGYERSAVSPRMLTPHMFTGIVETSEEVFTVDLDIFQGVTRQLARMRKSPVSEILSRAELSRTGTVFAGFARFPVARVIDTGAAYRVTFIDLRYYAPETGTGFGGTVVLDKSLQVIEETMGFNEAVN